MVRGQSSTISRPLRAVGAEADVKVEEKVDPKAKGAKEDGKKDKKGKDGKDAKKEPEPDAPEVYN